MAIPAVDIGDVGHAIQLALAPVFLLTGIAGILNVMAGRLARIIDRGRQLAERPIPQELQAGETLQLELQSLERRRHLAGPTGMTALLRLSAFITLCIGVAITWNGVKALLGEIGIGR